MPGAPTLVVEDLTTWFETRSGVVKAVDGVSFEVAEGRILGLVGESGSGKTVTGFSIMGLVDPPGRIVGGRVRFKGRDLVGLPDGEMRKLRGSRIAMIFQDPMMTLNPGVAGRHADDRDDPGARARRRRRPRGRGRGRRSPWSASPVPTSDSSPIRTSFPAACASASPSPSPS